MKRIFPSKKALVLGLIILLCCSFLPGCSVFDRELKYLTIETYDDPSSFDVSPSGKYTKTSFASSGDRYAFPTYPSNGFILYDGTKTRNIRGEYQYYDICFLGDKLYMLPIASFFGYKTTGLCCYDMTEKTSTTCFEDRRLRCIEPYGDSLLLAFGPNHNITEELLKDCGLYLYHPETEQLELLIPDIYCEDLYVKNGLIYISYIYSNEYFLSGSPDREHLICYHAEQKETVWDIHINNILVGQFAWCIMDDQNVLLYGYVNDENEKRNYQIVRCSIDGSSEVLLDHAHVYSNSIARDDQYIYFDRYDYEKSEFELLRYDLVSKQTEVIYTDLESDGHFEKWNNQLVYIFKEQ